MSEIQFHEEAGFDRVQLKPIEFQKFSIKIPNLLFCSTATAATKMTATTTTETITTAATSMTTTTTMTTQRQRQ